MLVKSKTKSDRDSDLISNITDIIYFNVISRFR